MRALQILFQSIYMILELYSLLCIARIIITWIPHVTYSKPGQFLAKICDPYLNLFRRFRWMQIGSIDFSPIVSLCLLEGISTIFGKLAVTQYISVGFILSLLLSIIWTIFSTIIGFFFFLLLVRLIFLLIEKNRHTRPNYIFEAIDRSIMPTLYKLFAPFCGKHRLTYTQAIIIALICCMLLSSLGTWGISKLSSLLAGIKF